MTSRLHHLPWDQPLLSQAVAWLAAGWTGQGPLDLSNLLVIVPTQQSGRRLREALAAHAHRRGQAAFPPQVITPDRLLHEDHGALPASAVESLLAWAEVLHELDLDDWREVFPVDPPARNFAWALRLARQFTQLQADLAESGLLMADVAGRAGDFPETARWRQLDALERMHGTKLAAAGRVDAQAAKIAAAQKPVLAPGLDRIVVLATPDPLPLAVEALAVLARAHPVEIAVFAPEEEAVNFDKWGRPLTAAWEHRVMELPEFSGRVHLCADPAAQAELVAQVARDYGEPEGRLAVGTADPEVLPVLESALQSAGLASFNPEGRALRQDGFHELLCALAELEREPAFEAVERLARCPDFIACLKLRLGESFSAARWLAGLDELRRQHLPASLAAAHQHAGELKDFPGLPASLEAVVELRSLLARGPFAEGVAAALTTIFAGRKAQAGSAADALLEETAGIWMKTVRECAAAAVAHPDLDRADWWELALHLFGEAKRTEEKAAGAVELQGWLELLWEDAPHLVVAGFNDDRVPKAVSGDAFLPESLRARLGLKTNAAWLARDAYMLQALAASRGRGGRLDLVFGKVSAVGDPLRPSRLLLRCPDPELPARVDFLFREPATPGASVAWARAWKLTLRRVPAPERVAVTALRSWLKCPFRFYLRHVLAMEPVDPSKTELDARDFGTLCHGALEAMGREAALRDCTDEGMLREFLLARLDWQVRRRWGAELTLPLLVQVESARQRLGKAAAVQARERAAGWVIVEVERKFGLPAGGLMVSGRIDRIERHETTGAVRVLDYKTSDSAAAPADMHFRPLKAEEALPDWMRIEWNGKPKAWSDLQLPVYLHALAAEFGRNVTCGYFNLPKAAGETGLTLWDGYTPELHEAAWGCVEGVGAAIRAGEFWPPRELAGRDAALDEFALLFHHGAAASVAWEEAKP